MTEDIRSMMFDYKYDIDLLVLGCKLLHIECGEFNSHPSKTNTMKNSIPVKSYDILNEMGNEIEFCISVTFCSLLQMTTMHDQKQQGFVQRLSVFVDNSSKTPQRLFSSRNMHQVLSKYTSMLHDFTLNNIQFIV